MGSWWVGCQLFYLTCSKEVVFVTGGNILSALYYRPDVLRNNCCNATYPYDTSSRYDNIKHLKGWYFNRWWLFYWTQVTSLSCLATHSPNQTKLKFGKELSMMLHIFVKVVTCISCYRPRFESSLKLLLLLLNWICCCCLKYQLCNMWVWLSKNTQLS